MVHPSFHNGAGDSAGKAESVAKGSVARGKRRSPPQPQRSAAARTAEDGASAAVSEGKMTVRRESLPEAGSDVLFLSAPLFVLLEPLMQNIADLNMVCLLLNGLARCLFCDETQ